MTQPSIIEMMLVLMGRITHKEADRLHKYLQGKEVPEDWRDVIKQIEDGIGTKIYNVSYKL